MVEQLFSQEILRLPRTGFSYKSTPSILFFVEAFFQNNLTTSKNSKSTPSLLFFHSLFSEKPLFFAETFFGTASLPAK